MVDSWFNVLLQRNSTHGVHILTSVIENFYFHVKEDPSLLTFVSFKSFEIKDHCMILLKYPTIMIYCNQCSTSFFHFLSISPKTGILSFNVDVEFFLCI